MRCLREIRLYAGNPGESSGTHARSDRCLSVMACESDNPRGVPQTAEPDNQQERLMTSESSETIRRTSAHADEDMVPTAWRHAGSALQGGLTAQRERDEQGLQRNSLSGKLEGLPRDEVIRLGTPAHIGEALRGNTEGSPSDPVTTDPMDSIGRWHLLTCTSAGQIHETPQHAGICDGRT